MENDKAITFKQFLAILIEWKKLLVLKWKTILIFVSIGALLGACYCFFSKPKYIAETNFVLSESKDEIANPLAMFGLGESGTAGLFEGENLMWLYTSKSMITQTLLTTVDSFGKPKLLIDWFINMTPKLEDMVNSYEETGHKISFASTSNNERPKSRYENGILNTAASIISKDALTVSYAGKSSSVITIKLSTKDEGFSKQFSDVIVQKVNIFYIETKTKRAKSQVVSLQKKVDQFTQATRKSMVGAAQSFDNTPYPNPNLQILKVPAQQNEIDVSLNSGIYAQMVQQLEAAQIKLAELTPLIQIVDEPAFPLSKEKPSFILMILVGIIVFGGLGVAYVFFKSFSQ